MSAVSCPMVTESDRAAPQTPPLMEPRPRVRAPFVRHRKTSSGFLDFDMNKLMAFPVEELPPDEEVDMSKECIQLSPGTEISIDDTTPAGVTPSSMYEGGEAVECGSISWPATPSCSSYKMNAGDDYDSDQDTVVEETDEDGFSTCSSEESLGFSLRDCDMNNTLVDDEAFAYCLEDSADNSESLPAYVGIGPDSCLMSIPEDSEMCLDKVGNHVLCEEKSVVRVSLERIESDAAGYCVSGREAGRLVSRGLGVEKAGRHQRSQTLLSDETKFNGEVECEVVLPDLNRIVKAKEIKNETKVSAGCCSFKKLTAFGKARRRLESIGSVLKKHWPIITSAVVPIVLFFTWRNK